MKSKCFFLSVISQCVQEKYNSPGWVQHHEHLLEYDDCNADNPIPSISVRVTEPADDDEKNWKVSMISKSRVSYK